MGCQLQLRSNGALNVIGVWRITSTYSETQFIVILYIVRYLKGLKIGCVGIAAARSHQNGFYVGMLL